MEQQKQKNELLIYEPHQLRELARNASPDRWIVDGWLRAGRRRPSGLTAKKGTGKSTLAHQLCVDASKGKPFLGRATERCEVLLWKTEDTPKDVWDDLAALG